MTKFLLPRPFRFVGFVLFPLSLLSLRAYYAWDYALPLLYRRRYWTEPDGSRANTFDYNIAEQTGWVLAVLSLCMIAFSRLKTEDEYVRTVRLDSILLSIYLYVLLFIIVVSFFWDAALGIVILNIIPVLFLFIIIFNVRMFVLPRFTKKIPQ